MADGQAREGVGARAVGRDRLPDARVRVGRGHGGFRNHRAGGVFNGSRNAAPDGGRAGQYRKPKQKGQNQKREERIGAVSVRNDSLTWRHANYHTTLAQAESDVTML